MSNNNSKLVNLYDSIIAAHAGIPKQKSVLYTDTLRDLSTVHINLGRRTDKTHYIIEKSSTSDLIVCSSLLCLKKFKKALDSKNKDVIVHTADFITSNRQCFRDMVFDKVWVDEPMMCFDFNRKKLESFYFAVEYARPTQIIMLGE